MKKKRKKTSASVESDAVPAAASAVSGSTVGECVKVKEESVLTTEQEKVFNEDSVLKCSGFDFWGRVQNIIPWLIFTGPTWPREENE